MMDYLDVASVHGWRAAFRLLMWLPSISVFRTSV